MKFLGEKGADWCEDCVDHPNSSSLPRALTDTDMKYGKTRTELNTGNHMLYNNDK